MQGLQHVATNLMFYVNVLESTTSINHRIMFQYPWSENELYLFRASVAYALRQYYSQQNETLVFT